MSVGSIYQHFGSKEGMIEAAVVDALVAWDHWVEAEIADVDDEAERLVTPMRLLTRLAPVLDSLSDAVESMTSGTDVLRLRLGVLPLWASQRSASRCRWPLRPHRM